MKNWVRSAISLVLISALSLGLLFGLNAVTKDRIAGQAQEALKKTLGEILPADSYEEVDLTAAADYADIKQAYTAFDASGNVVGYVVSVVGKGYHDGLNVTVALNADGTVFNGLRVGENEETEGIGTKVTDAGFYGQFANLSAPTNIKGDPKPGSPAPAKQVPAASEWVDGTYYAEQADFDGAGYKYTLEMTIENQKITSVLWDALEKDGKANKRQGSMDKTYDMDNAPGLWWHEQAELTEQNLIKTQDPLATVLESNGKTDAIAGVTVEIASFTDLAIDCLNQSAAATPAAPAAPGGEATLKDGTYKAEEADYDEYMGYKYFVELTVKDGKIVSALWDAVHKDGQPNKRQASIDGTYDMNNAPGLWWHEQAEAMEAKLIETQNPVAVSYDADGVTDAVAGVTMEVKSFTTLAQLCVEQATDKPVSLKDGTYHAEQADFDPNNGYKYFVDVTIKDGKIESVLWDATNKDGNANKRQASIDGTYDMKNAPGLKWHEQAELMEAKLVETQDPLAVVYGENGKTDAVAGVSVTIDAFNTLAQQCLDQAKDQAPAEEAGGLTNGTFHAEEADFDASGYKYTVDVTVEGGKVTQVIWDALEKDGKANKRQASIDKTYDMDNAPGLWWHEQAELMEAKLVETQNPLAVEYGNDGKTDAVAGVTVEVKSFTTLAIDAMNQAGAGIEAPKAPEAATGDGIDAVAGATVSSRGVVTAANRAWTFVTEYLLSK